MMAHMLECYAALCAAQQHRNCKEQSSRFSANKTQQAKNKAFKIAMSVMSQGIRHDNDTDLPDCSSALSDLIEGNEKHTDGHGWIPLQWATITLETPVGDLFGLTEEDVHLLHANDPMAFARCLKQSNPAQLLCMQPMTTCRMSLLRYFSICNQQAVIKSNPSLLHVVCKHGYPTLELLQFLLQLYSSQLTTIFNHADQTLEYLCSRDGCNHQLINCLLEVDSSAKAVGEALSSSIHSDDFSTMLEKVDMLLKVNPEAAKYRSDVRSNLSHDIVWCSERAARPATYPGRNGKTAPSSLGIELMQRILALHSKEVALKEYCEEDGSPPVHLAAKWCTLEVMEFLLDLHPESARVYTAFSSDNLLHMAANAHTDIDAKVRYLCSRYPEVSSNQQP